MRKLSAENHHCNINHKVTLVRLNLLEIRIFNLTLCTAVCQAAKYAYTAIIMFRWKSADLFAYFRCKRQKCFDRYAYVIQFYTFVIISIINAYFLYTFETNLYK